MIQIRHGPMFMLQFHKDLFYVHYYSFSINDLSDNLTSNAKLFADDTSLFSVVDDANTSAKELNNHLKNVNDWAYQWKISFNPDPRKQSQEVIFHSQIKEFDPSTHLTYSQKYLGVI